MREQNLGFEGLNISDIPRFKETVIKLRKVQKLNFAVHREVLSTFIISAIGTANTGSVKTQTNAAEYKKSKLRIETRLMMKASQAST